MQVRPLSERVNAAMFQIAAEFEQALQEEIANHRGTLNLLQRLKRGELGLDQVVVSDDGWRVMPPEPKEEMHDSPSNGAVPAHVG